MAFKHYLGLIGVAFCAIALVTSIVSLSSRHWATCSAKQCPQTMTTSFGLFAYYSCFGCCNNTLPAPGVCGFDCHTYYWADPSSQEFNPHPRQASRVASALLITGIVVSLFAIVGGVLRTYEKEAFIFKRKVQFFSNLVGSVVFLVCVLSAPLFYSLVFPLENCFLNFSWFLNFVSGFLLLLAVLSFLSDLVFNRQAYSSV